MQFPQKRLSDRNIKRGCNTVIFFFFPSASFIILILQRLSKGPSGQSSFCRRGPLTDSNKYLKRIKSSGWIEDLLHHVETGYKGCVLREKFTTMCNFFYTRRQMDHVIPSLSKVSDYIKFIKFSCKYLLGCWRATLVTNKFAILADSINLIILNL